MPFKFNPFTGQLDITSLSDDFYNSVSSVNVNSNHTVTIAERILLCDSTGGTFNITLPDPSLRKSFKIKDVGGAFGTNNVTLVRFGSENIEGLAASFALASNYGSYILFSDGTNWWLL